jgi:hypothetical protein
MSMTDLTNPYQAVKKLYTSPKLVRHGDVRGLTQAGTSGMAEMANDGDKKKKL